MKPCIEFHLTNNKGYAQKNGESVIKEVWETHWGPVPKGLQICHTCDNRACIEPSHLFLGTQVANFLDMVNKNRASGPKLDEEKVKEIRILAGKVPYKDISDHYGINLDSIKSVVTRKTWAWVTEPEQPVCRWCDKTYRFVVPIK